MDTRDAIITCADLAFSYPAPEGAPPSPPVFEHLDFNVRRGSFVTVLGHNGSGKSTLAKHFNAILLPVGGRVYVGGIDTSDEKRLLEVRSLVGMVFQNPDNQIVATVVEEDIAFGPENLGVPPGEIRVRVDEALRSVGMYEYRMHAPHQLSGGQKQRIAIAGILAMRPDCIVLDEPTAMLDPRGRREVLRTVKRLGSEYGITVVLITHFMDEAAQSERVVVMDNGRIILDAPPRQVFSHVEKLKSVGLDVPQATELIYGLRAEGFDLPGDIITEADCVEAISSRIGGSASGAGPVPRVAVREPSRGGAAPEAGRTIIRTEKLTYLYSPGTPFEKAAIRDIDLEIEEGAFVGVIGHTGSGKSTLIQHFNGLLRPSAGKVYIDGEDIWENPREIRKYRFKVGLVFQYPEYQLFEETVYKDIAFGPRNMGLSEAEIDYRVRAVAELVELGPKHMQKSPFELSGGQKRRVALAGVMAMTPDVLILDEPTAGLDPRGRDRVLGEIREYHRQQKNTILLVSHSMEDIARYAQKVLVLNESRVYMYDDVDKVFAHAGEIGKMGLSVPQVTRICAGLNARGHDVSAHTYTVEDAREQILPLLRKGAG